MSPDKKKQKEEMQRVKELYMASPHVEWPMFVKSMGWDLTSANKQYKSYKNWVVQKKDILSKEHAEKIAELVFDYKSKWHQEVLQTLREYPKASDVMLKILNARMTQIVRLIREDEENNKLPAEQRQESKFKKVTTAELSCLANSIKTVTETKYKSLLIADWNVKIAESVSTPETMSAEQNKKMETEWNIQVIGHEKMKASDLQKALTQWYDRPILPHTPRDLDADS